MLRRLMGILIALALPLAAVGAVAFASHRPGLPENAQITLDRYLAHRSRVGQAAAVAGAQRAAFPLAFTAGLSRYAYGSPYYFSTYSDDTPWVTVNAPLAGAALSLTLKITPMASQGSQRPLPYPPSEAWCVRLQPQAAGSAPVTVLVALHGDLYLDTWVVHELAPAAQQRALDLVGCSAP